MRLLLVVALSALVSATRAASSASLECGACMLVVAEVEKAVRAVDPKKTIDAGSFRVNHKGEQVGLQKVPFARSNGHIVELLEKACDRTTDYRHVLNKLTGKKVYVNKDSTWLKGDESKSMQSKLHSACNDLIDDHGDELEKFFQKEHDEPARELCLTKIGVCTSVDVSPMPPMEPEEEKKEEEDKNEL